MSLPLTQTDSPSSAAELASIVRETAQARGVIYPLGGETSLDYGLRGRVPGRGISLKKLNRVIDYPARDMTITVEAGMTIAELQDILAAENQELPIDIPQSESATIGGALVTNMNGPRRWGLGTWRDYVIGVEAVDGLGRIYHAGGRVVKNVAGYDFCRLLIGSCGTLGIVTQVTLKLKPKSETSAAILLPIAQPTKIESILAQLSTSRAQLAAVELVNDTSRWQVPAFSEAASDSVPWLIVYFEGTQPEVRWMSEIVLAELQAVSDSGIAPRLLEADHAQAALRSMTELLARGEQIENDDYLFGLKSVVPSSRVAEWIDTLQSADPTCFVHANALSGIVYSHHFAEPKAGLTKWLLNEVHPRARALDGFVQVWNFPREADLTGPTAWGTTGDAGRILTEIRKQFDPQSVLNPGRFW